jgi:hypothetical protein
MAIVKDNNIFGMQCDACGNAISTPEATDYKGVNAAAKAEGWINRQINDKWYNFCCQECYENKKAQVEQTELGLTPEPQTQETGLPHNWKCKMLETEIRYIENAELSQLAQRLINGLPDYFFKVAASSTGKYHPKYALGEGGLIRHTKAAVRIAVELLRIEQYQYLKPAHDYIIIALLLHDGFKHGLPKEDGTYSHYSVSEHSVIAADYVRNNIGLAREDILNYIADLMLTHMGEWNMSYNSGAIFAPKPTTAEQQFVHMCDYLASRKCLEFNGEEPFVA